VRNREGGSGTSASKPRATPVILAKPDRSGSSSEIQRGRKGGEFPTLQQAHAPSVGSITIAGSNRDRVKATQSPTPNEIGKRSESPAVVGLGKVLLGRKDSPISSSADVDSNSSTQENTSRLDQQPSAPVPTTSSTGPTHPSTSDPINGAVPPFREKSARLIDEQQQFCTSGLGSVMTDNTEFLVVGVIGLQSVGKSTILNRLANYIKPSGAEELFREQTMEKQIMSEHCTNGVKAWISPTTRCIFLDTQPLSSMSMLDRAMQIVEKKHNAEFGTLEATIEIQSLQIIGFLMSVCHVLVLVQDHFVDANLMETIQTAEMLKPSSPALIAGGGNSMDGEGSNANSGQVVEYFPEFVIVHNKSHLDDFSVNRQRVFQDFYKRVFALSQLKFNTGKVSLDSFHSADDGYDNSMSTWSANPSKMKWKMGQVNLCILPEFDREDQDGKNNWDENSCYNRHFTFEDCAAKLRRKIVSIPPANLTTTKLSEKLWLKYAEKTWDNIKNCPFYGEYSRLLNS